MNDDDSLGKQLDDRERLRSAERKAKRLLEQEIAGGRFSGLDEGAVRKRLGKLIKRVLERRAADG